MVDLNKLFSTRGEFASLKVHFMHTSIDIKNKPRPYHVTRCLLKDGDKLVAVGVSVCSPQDQYNRKKGNLISYGRAAKAYDLKETDHYIGVNLEAKLGVQFLQEYLPDNYKINL